MLQHSEVITGIFLCFSVLLLSYYACGRLGRLIKSGRAIIIRVDLVKIHTIAASLTVLSAIATANTARLLAATDIQRREHSWVIDVHIVSASIFILGIIAMMVFNGSVRPKLHSRILKLCHISLAVMFLTSIYFI
jgi:hypothetical protein